MKRRPPGAWVRLQERDAAPAAKREPSARELVDAGMPIDLAREVDFILRLPHDRVSWYCFAPTSAAARLLAELRAERISQDRTTGPVGAAASPPPNGARDTGDPG